MSDIRPPYDDDRSPLPLPRRHGCLTAIMVIVGIILLLPGLCALIFAANVQGTSSMEPGILGLVLLCLMVGVLGVFLIWRAIRAPRS
jgi:drug/metabolite transporter (DMT)-like permease